MADGMAWGLEQAFASDPNASRFKIIALICFVILAVGAFVVVVILPDQLSKKHENVHVASEAPSIQTQLAEESGPKPGKTEAHALLQQVLKYQFKSITHPVGSFLHIN